LSIYLSIYLLSKVLTADFYHFHFSQIMLSVMLMTSALSANQRAPSHSCLSLQVRSKVVFIRDSLVQISDLYRHDNLSSVTWDMDNTNRFRMSIDRQIDGLNTCVSTEQRADNSLRKYYRRLRTSTLDRTVSTSTVNTDCNTVCTD
uniref:Uncharacterized protein n=1 Tax=Seriola lalandi dorsalis TaxID=1841481 RepID=A0A3B4X9S6_SERLL